MRESGRPLALEGANVMYHPFTDVVSCVRVGVGVVSMEQNREL